MPSFNASQQEAIQARNRNVLVSAAAGSGKTTVMVEKIRETLMTAPGASISDFLVITFTRDAARNMKNKLRDLLEKAAQNGDERASGALNEIETATISTIHAFCTQLLTEYNDNSGASMTPRVLKDAQRKRMFGECFSDAAERLTGRESPCGREDRQAVSALLTAFSLEEIAKMTEDLYNVLMGIPDPFAFLERIVKELPAELWNREILNAAELDVMGLEELLRQEEELMRQEEALAEYEAVAQSDTELAETFLTGFRQKEKAEEKKALLDSARAGFVKAPTIRGLDEEAKAWKKKMDDVRTGIKGSSPKGLLAEVGKRLDRILDENNERLNGVIRQELRGLELLVRETAGLYEQRKLEEGAIDYADMEQIAYRIISDPDRREELLNRYKYIYVDECQDVSGIQDAIIKSLTGPGHQLFMVGDIKQSIYGFRHAEPELFEHERRTYSDDQEAENRRIFFMDNYRSCKSVVDAVNEVFTEAMDRQITDMDYLPEDNLRCNRQGDFGPVDVMLIRNGEDTDPLEAQCEAAGQMILKLISGAWQTGDMEPLQYRDIVILVRAARGVGADIAEHLKKMQIPAVYEGVPDFFGLAEVKAFLCLLTVIDNLHNDDALVGTLINTPFLFTERDLADIRLADMEDGPFYRAFETCARRNRTPADVKCAQAMERLKAWRKASESMSVPDFVWWLMRDTGIYAARGAYPDGKARQANLDTLYQRALDGAAAGSMRLSDFVSDLRQARETRQSDSDDHLVFGAGDNFVRIMTMHKSKGLEFPAVLLMDLHKSIRKKRSDEKLRMDVSSSGGALGLYLPAVRRTRHSVMDSQGREAFDQRAVRKNISEMTRLLYVAMTRAEKHLCLIGCVKDGEEALWSNRMRSARIWKTRSMLDMIMPAVLKHLPLPETGKTAEDDLWRLTVLEGRGIAEREADTAEIDEQLRSVLQDGRPVSLPPRETVERLPLKTSVTTLTRQARVLSDDDAEETVEDKRRTEEMVRTFMLSSAPARPAFLEEEKAEAVNIGTATHRFMRLISLDALRADPGHPDKVVREEAARMRAAGILTEEEAGRIRLKGAASFFASGLGKRMLRSPEIRREATFTMKMTPRSATMVQGIVDCVFMEEGEWILIDYKTDYETAEDIFVPRHEMQMNWYRTALEKVTGIPVREMWLFALRAGKAFAVKRIDVAEKQV